MSHSNRIDAEKRLNGSIPRVVLSIAIPTVLGLLSSSVYHLFDALFVARLGTDASAAVGVTFAVQTLLQALGYTFGTGGGSLLARCLGKGNRKEAQKLASLAFLLSLITGGLIIFSGLLFQSPLLRLLGTTERSFPYAQAYWRVFLWSAPAVCANFTMSQLLRSEGHAMQAMWGLVIGNAVNILLDPFLIFTCALGIKGAAWATVIGQWLGFLILFSFYWRKKTQISVLEDLHHPHFSMIGKLLIAGSPSLLRQGLIFLATLLINRTASQIGEYALTAMSVTSRIFLFTFSFCAGIGQGMMSAVGYHFGAGRQEQVSHALRFALTVSTIGMGVISLPLLLFTPQILNLFHLDAQTVQFGIPALRWQMAVLVLHGIITCAGMYLQAIGRSLWASIVAGARQGIFFLPLIVLLPIWFGLPAFRYVQPLADLFSAMLSAILLFFFLKKASDQKSRPQRRD